MYFVALEGCQHHVLARNARKNVRSEKMRLHPIQPTVPRSRVTRMAPCYVGAGIGAEDRSGHDITRRKREPRQLRGWVIYVKLLHARGGRDTRFYGYQGDSGRRLLVSAPLPGLRHFQAPIATPGRLYVAMA